MKLIRYENLFLFFVCIVFAFLNSGCKTSEEQYTGETYTKEEQDYFIKEYERRLESNFKKAQRYYDLGIYDSAQHYCKLVVNDPKYLSKAKTLLFEIDSKILAPQISDINLYIEGKNYTELYKTLQLSRMKLPELASQIVDSLVYISLLPVIEDNEYEFMGKYYELFSRDSKYRDYPEIIQAYDNY